MFQKITKRQFINTIKSCRHALIGCVMGDIDLSRFETMCLDGLDIDREVVSVKSNHLVFSDDSRLYFDSFATRTYRECVRDDGYILLAVEIWERGCPLPKNLVYGGMTI